MKTMKMPKDRFNKLADERELRCPNATYILINGAERDKGVLTSEWFNRAGFFWCQCTEKQLQKMRLLLRAQGCKTIMRDDGEWFVLKNGNIIKA